MVKKKRWKLKDKFKHFYRILFQKGFKSSSLDYDV